MNDIDRVYRDCSTAKLKTSLVEASRLVREYARSCGDPGAESSIHQTIDMMLDELRLRGEL